MSKQMIIGIIIGAATVTAVGSVAGYRYLAPDKYAEVISVTPVMNTVSEPREVCQDKLVTVKNSTNDPKQITGIIAGALIGGLIGNQVGGGSGKKIATAAGAAAGGYAGNKIQEDMQKKNTSQVSKTVCKTVYDTHEEQAGFEVTYLYDGQQKVIHIDHDPGARIAMENNQPAIFTKN